MIVYLIVYLCIQVYCVTPVYHLIKCKSLMSFIQQIIGVYVKLLSTRRSRTSVPGKGNHETKMYKDVYMRVLALIVMLCV